MFIFRLIIITVIISAIILFGLRFLPLCAFHSLDSFHLCTRLTHIANAQSKWNEIEKFSSTAKQNTVFF